MRVNRGLRSAAPFFATLFTLAACAGQQVRSDLREATAVRGEHSIDVGRYVTLGGIEQWITVRGGDTRNPLLLFLHGGPGFTSLPTRYFYQRGWPEYFTVVQWDQRGAGKTFARSPDAPLSLERMVQDAEELVTFLRRTYGKERIVLVGHSWGTVLGLKLAQKHPDWFSAYVGIAQVVDVQRSEHQGYEETLAAAKAAGNTRAVAELEGIAPFPDPNDPGRTLRNLEVERRWLTEFGGYTKYAGDGYDVQIARHSPDYTDAELGARYEGIDHSVSALWPTLGDLSFLDIRTLNLPVFFFEGKADRDVSSTLVAEWFEGLQAPHKELVWFQRSGHLVPEEEPGKTLVTLVTRVRPMAMASGNGAAPPAAP